MKATAALFTVLCMVPLGSAKPPADTQARLDAWVAGRPGGIALAWVDADGPAFFTAGKFSADDPRAITADTQFEMGSVTKVFTSLLLAESERLGKVNREDAAAKFLLPPEDAAQKSLAKISLLSLATHASGLPRLPFNIGPNADANPDPYAKYSRDDLVAALRVHGPTAPVGRSAAYSNFGAAVLGEALAAAWGSSYDAALHGHVLDPLGMNATTVALTGAAPSAQLAPSHAIGVRVPSWNFLAFAPAGALRSSAREMAIFLSACLHPEKSPLRAALEMSFQRQRPFEDVGGGIGLGWLISDDSEQPVTWHSGATLGSRSFVGFNPKTRVGVALLANVPKTNDELGFALLGGKPPRPAVATVKNGEDYVGRYALTPAVAIDVTTRAEGLFVQLTGQPVLTLRESSVDRFAVAGVPAEISFSRDAMQRVIALTLHQNGLDQRAPRGELPPSAKEVALPAEVLAEYPGKYELAPGAVLTVIVEGTDVFVQLTGQSRGQVFASAKDEFFAKIVAASFTFERDPAGKVIALVLHQNGRDQRAKRIAD
jgi:serine-type D-Ala-D-Ala carboxypeptidase/endopeptidase